MGGGAVCGLTKAAADEIDVAMAMKEEIIAMDFIFLSEE